MTNSATTYTPPMEGGGTAAYCNYYSTIAPGEGIWPTGGTFSDLCVELTGAPGTSKSYQFTIYVNGSSTAQTVTVSGADTIECTAGAAASVSAGQPVSVEIIPSGTPTAVSPRISYVFNSTTAGESVFVVAQGSTNMNALQNNRRTPIPNGGSDWQINDDRRFTASTSGTLKNMYCRIGADPDNGAGVDDYTLTIRENGANAAITTTIADGATTNSDTSNTIAVAAGDTYALNQVSSGSPTATTGGCGLVFLADTPGEWIIPSGFASSSTATVYGSMNYGTNNSTASSRDGLASIGFTVTNIYVTLASATDADGTLAFDLFEENTTGMATTCTVGIASSTCNGTDDSTVTALNTYEMRSIPATTPGGLQSWIGLTGFISEAAPGARRVIMVN